MTFGGKICPFDWCTILEPIVDLANTLLECPDCDPSLLHSPAQDRVPKLEYLPDNIPLAQARELLIKVPTSENRRVDEYSNNLLTLGPDLSSDHRERLAAATFLTIHITTRENSKIEPLP